MRVKTIAEVKNNQLIINDSGIFVNFPEGQKVYVTIEEIEHSFVSTAERIESIKVLESFSRKSRIITPDGMIKREDAYTEK
jgi:predicted RNA-binding protein with RPS1 domain